LLLSVAVKPLESLLKADPPAPSPVTVLSVMAAFPEGAG